MTKQLEENGWTPEDIDRAARALVEAARREGMRPTGQVYQALTDEQWRQHKNVPALQYVFTDARIVLSAVAKNGRQTPQELPQVNDVFVSWHAKVVGNA